MRQALLLGAVQEVAHEIGNVLRALAQGRQADRHDVQAEEQILAEEALVDELAQVAVRRRDDAHVRFHGHAPADGRVLSLLQHAQESRLRLQRHVADFIEEERTAFSLLEPSDAAPGRAGERALLMAEQIGLDQLARDRRHVDGDERTVPALAVIVQRAGDEFLARAALARDHHSQVRRHQSREHAVDVLHRGRAPNERNFALVLSVGSDAAGLRSAFACKARRTMLVSSLMSNGLGRYS